jgi:hypothetical protein
MKGHWCEGLDWVRAEYIMEHAPDLYVKLRCATRPSLASDIGLRGIILGIERVKVLLKLLVGRDTGIDRAANCFHAEPPFSGLSRRPKNLGPFQRVPVMANATCDRLG